MGDCERPIALGSRRFTVAKSRGALGLVVLAQFSLPPRESGKKQKSFKSAYLARRIRLRLSQ
jgi:hypothetical protein